MLSIVIPVLNESFNLPKLLSHIADNAEQPDYLEIIIVDGGSSDNTLELAEAFKNSSQLTIKVISSERGRAKQMNAGAKNSNGSVLYFLHADSYPPKNFDTYIMQEVKNGNPAGCFKMRFNSNHFWLKLAGYLTKFSWRASRGGDQSQFITRNLFNEIGGYDESYIIYEDNILINELYARKKFVVIQQPILSSARMYEKHGVWVVQYHFWSIYVKKWMGASAEELHKYYCEKLKK